jgi:hypothetical protein
VAGNRPAWRSRRALVGGGALLAVILLVGHLFWQAVAIPGLPWAGLGKLGQVCANPSGQHAWISGDDQTSHIFIGNSDQSQKKELRSEPAAMLPTNLDTLVALTADASRLAYATASDLMLDNAHLWYIDVANPGQPHELASVATGLWIVQPVWSPDKKRLAYVRVDDGATHQDTTQVELWIAEVGGRPWRLAALPNVPIDNFYGDQHASLCWAADNRTLVLENVTTAALAAGEGTPAAAASPGTAAASQTVAGRTSLSFSAASSTFIASSTFVASSTFSASSVSSAPSTSRSATAIAATAPAAASAGAACANSGAADPGPHQVEIDVATGQCRVADQANQPATPLPPDRSPIRVAGTSCAVPILSQNDPRWRMQIMQSRGDLIGNYGCALTSTTMVLDYYGFRLTPDQLGQCLHSSADYLLWWQVPQCTQGIITFVAEHDFSWQELDSELQTGNPAIVGFKGGPAGMHWVVVTAGGGGGDGSNYAVIDPWDASTNKTLQYFISRGYVASWIVEYVGPGSPCDSRLIVLPGQAGGTQASTAATATGTPRPSSTGTPRPGLAAASSARPSAGPGATPTSTAGAGTPNAPVVALSPGPTATPRPLATIPPALTPAAEAWRAAPPAPTPPGAIHPAFTPTPRSR